MKLSIQKNGLALAAFAGICTLVVSVVNYLTKDTIEAQKQLVLLQTLNQILPQESYNNDLAADCTLITNKAKLGSDKPQRIYRARLDEKPIAVVIETTAPDGYSGSIELMMAVKLDGTISGVKTLRHKETPGLGDKIEERKSDWIFSFKGQQVNGENDNRWAVKKDNGMFDQFTGATITPRAVVKAVKKTALYFAAEQQQIFAQAANCNDNPNTVKGAANE